MAENALLKIDHTGLNAFIRRIQALGMNPAPFMSALGQLITRSVRHNFDVGGRYSSSDSVMGGTKRWRLLAADTLLRSLNKRDFKKSGTLSASGARKSARRLPLNTPAMRLRDSITYSVAGSSLEVGTKVKYAAAQHFGMQKTITPKNKKALVFFWAGAIRFMKKVDINIPARPFMVVQREDIAAAVRMGKDYMKGATSAV